MRRDKRKRKEKEKEKENQHKMQNNFEKVPCCIRAEQTEITKAKNWQNNKNQTRNSAILTRQKNKIKSCFHNNQKIEGENKTRQEEKD